MNTRNPRWSRATRRLVFGTLIGAGVIVGLSQSASAAVTSSFSNGTLTVFGDNLNNNLQISRNAAGQILVNGGAVQVLGGTPTVANTTLIQVFGQGGNDTITLNEASGALPRANLFGGAGNDTLTGGSGGDMLFGQSNNDTLLGKGGFDFLFGGSEHDALTGGDADDQVFGESGNDSMIWNPGDDTDLNEGGDGTDTVQVNGGNGTEAFTTTANGTRVRFDRTVPAPFSIDIGTSEKLVLNANGGDDQFSATGNLATLIAITVDGGTGADTILGGNGNDLLIGGDNDDFVDGNQGNDTAQLGAGNDVFQWDPGDGSDTVEGQDGTADTMRFNGSAIGEIFDASANGQRLRFTRNIGNIVMDVNDLEILDVNAFGGADNLTVNDLTATDVVTVDSDLAATLGSATGDAAADTIVVNGTNGDDTVDIAGAGTSASVVGLHAQVNIANAEGATDSLVVSTANGQDAVTAAGLPAGIIKLTVDGGTGKDTILGSQGDDTILGGDGDDLVVGGRGNDVARMGANDDVFQWNPGDGSDTLEGEGGLDSMSFSGANIDENIDVSANGGRIRFFRDVANITMDLDDVENIGFRGLAGADNVAIQDLTGTDASQIGLDLNGPNGVGDGAADTVTVNGTQVNDSFGAAGNASGVTVSGLKATVKVVSPEVANDRLTLNGQGGVDTIDASALTSDALQLAINGGLGDDTMIGSAGPDTVNGGDGADSGLLGDGDDTFVWNPGDDNDVIEGQNGFDSMAFNGANIAEKIDVSANGQRGRLFRDVANVTMDFDGVETVALKALGGADTITVNDLTGTDVVSVVNDLFASGGVSDDGAPDNVIVNATNGDDVVVVTGSGNDAAVIGLSTQVTLTGAFSPLDRITVNALDGDDVVEASSLTITPAQLTANGGNGDDVLIGGDGPDTLNGDAGDDVLIGGPGVDILDGGPDDNVVIQLVAEEPVVSATVADEQWIEDHVEVVDGTTVIEVDGEQKALPETDLSELLADTAPAA